jgi:chromosome segregation ATPase
MSSYIKTNCCQNIAQKCCSGNLYSPKEDVGVTISKLNSKITKLEQQEKDFEILNQEYKQLENEYILMNEAKLRLEYEIKQREETFNKQLSDLNCMKDNLKKALSDKTCVNTKLMEEKNCLLRHLKAKNDEIEEVKQKINDNNERINSTLNNNGGLKNEKDELDATIRNQQNQIEELIKDKNKLTQICKEQEYSLNLSEQEKLRLNKKLRDDDVKLSNLNSKIRIHSNNLNILRKQLDDSNTLNLRLRNNLKNLQNEFAGHKVDNQNLREQLIIENNARLEEDQKNEQLNCILCDRKNKLKCLSNDYNKMVNSHNYMSQEKCMRTNDNIKLNDKIKILTCQNQNLIDEIERGIKADEYMRNILSRNERMNSLIKENDSVYSNTPKDMKIFNKTCAPKSYGFNCKNNDIMEKTYNLTRDGTFWPKCNHNYK